MQGKTTVISAATLAVAIAGLIGWQSWNTHQLQQQVAQLQQQVAAQSGSAAPNTPGTPQALANINPQLAPPSPQSGTTPLSPPNAAPLNPPGSGDPFWGGQDPFADMQRMQEEMHQRMQQLMSGMGMGGFGSSLFDMDPFQDAPGFGSSMGFGADPEFGFSENADNYQLSIAIPDNSKVEVSTEVKGRDLTIEGKVTVEEQNQAGGGGFRSMQTRQFARTLTLPADVDPLGITNQTANGQVVITLPKQQSNQLGTQQIPSGPQV